MMETCVGIITVFFHEAQSTSGRDRRQPVHRVVTPVTDDTRYPSSLSGVEAAQVEYSVESRVMIIRRLTGGCWMRDCRQMFKGWPARGCYPTVLLPSSSLYSPIPSFLPSFIPRLSPFPFRVEQVRFQSFASDSILLIIILFLQDTLSLTDRPFNRLISNLIISLHPSLSNHPPSTSHNLSS